MQACTEENGGTLIERDYDRQLIVGHEDTLPGQGPPCCLARPDTM